MQVFLDQFGLTFEDFANPAKEAKGEWVKIKLDATHKPTGKLVTIECWVRHTATGSIDITPDTPMQEQLKLAELSAFSKTLPKEAYRKADHDRHPFQKYMKNTKKRGYSQR